MTMHLQKGLYNTNTKKRKQFRKPGWQKAQADHDAYLIKMGAHSSQRKGKEFITGIATMHKSNLVPVNKNTDGAEYATMRRG
mgnify:CR=1 FL=1